MKEQVKHTGRVVSITPQLTTVEIVSHASCAECHAASVCGMSEFVEKAIQVPTSPYAKYGVGDEVQVVLKASMGMKAVWIAYFLPLLVLLAVALGLIAAGVTEVWAGLAGIAAVGVYFFVIWLLRDRLRNEYVFAVEEK
ncbi:MAG: SoxR reducing system RseC family protein [Bacteroidales bacterium]|nr:SoxR reducing system RseC family protein [Bacteroidales bacterium]